MKLSYIHCILTWAVLAVAQSPAEPNPELLPELNKMASYDMQAESTDELFFDLRQILSNDTVRCGEVLGSSMDVLVNDEFNERAIEIEFYGNYFAFRDMNGGLLRVLTYQQYLSDPMSAVSALKAAYKRLSS